MIIQINEEEEEEEEGSSVIEIATMTTNLWPHSLIRCINGSMGATSLDVLVKVQHFAGTGIRILKMESCRSNTESQAASVEKVG